MLVVGLRRSWYSASPPSCHSEEPGGLRRISKARHGNPRTLGIETGLTVGSGVGRGRAGRDCSPAKGGGLRMTPSDVEERKNGGGAGGPPPFFSASSFVLSDD